MYEIKDWAGNTIVEGFISFDEAEDHLNNMLGDSYEEDRQEYYIEQV